MSSILASKTYCGVTAELLQDNGDGTGRVRLIDVGDWYYEGPSGGDELTTRLTEWTVQAP